MVVSCDPATGKTWSFGALRRHPTARMSRCLSVVCRAALHFFLHTLSGLTASGHVALFPTQIRVGGVAPDADPAVLRVAAVVGGGVDAAVWKHAIAVELVLVRRLRRPRLASSTADRHRHVPDVRVPGRRQRAVPHTYMHATRTPLLTAGGFTGEGGIGRSPPPCIVKTSVNYWGIR